MFFQDFLIEKTPLYHLKLPCYPIGYNKRIVYHSWHSYADIQKKGVLPYISSRWVPQSLLLKPLRVWDICWCCRLLAAFYEVVRVPIWSASTTCCTSGNLPSSVEGIFFALSRRVLATESLCWVVGVFNEDTNITIKWFTEGSSENVHIWKLTKN